MRNKKDIEIAFNQTGIVLYTLKYKECLEFYEHVLGLKKLFEKKQLCCFAFGATYLMVELDDEYHGKTENEVRTKTCLRMHVPNVKVVANKVRNHGIMVSYQEYNWGTIAKFFDPDGNLCAFKDIAMFEQQIQDYKNNLPLK